MNIINNLVQHALISISSEVYAAEYYGVLYEGMRKAREEKKS